MKYSSGMFVDEVRENEVPGSIGRARDWSGEAVIDMVHEGGVFRPNGIVVLNGNAKRRHLMKVHEAARLTADALMGRLDPFLFKQAWNPTDELYVEKLSQLYPAIIGRKQVGLRETMSYSDYSALTVDVLDRMLYGYYTDAPISNKPLVKVHTLRDFRLVARYEMDGGVKPFSRMPTDFPSLVPHGAGEPPTQRAVQQAAREVEGSTQRVTYQPQLYQGSMSINWRALVNDDLGIFQDLIKRLAISGNRTIYSFITGLYISSGGWNTTLYNSTFANLVTTAYGAQSNNPALSYQGLLDARTVLAKMLDLDGQPIDFAGKLFLTVGPALENTAISMAKATQIGISVGGGTQNVEGFPQQWLTTPNWPFEGVTPIVDKYIPLICTGSMANTMWSLTYDPNAQARPSLELGMLQGYETPQLFQKVPNTMRVGGGVDPILGDFWTMNQDYKGILVLGGTQIDGRSTVASTGLGV
jgi:hypothetical protein